MAEVEHPDINSVSEMLIERIKDKVREENILKRLSDSVANAVSKLKLRYEKVSLEVDVSQNEHGSFQAVLKDAWQAVRGSKTAIVFLVDEASVLESNKGKLLMFLRAVLEQLQTERVPVMFVPAGKLSLSDQGTGMGFSPLVRTFPPAMMNNFTKEETRHYVEKKLKPPEISIQEPEFLKIFEITEGHPYVLTAYLHRVFEKLGPNEKRISTIHLEAANVEFVKYDLNAFFARFYEKTGPTQRSIMKTIAESGNSASLSELTTKLSKDSNQLSPYIAKLVQMGAIIRVERGEYALFHHLLKEHIQRVGS